MNPIDPVLKPFAEFIYASDLSADMKIEATEIVGKIIDDIINLTMKRIITIEKTRLDLSQDRRG